MKPAIAWCDALLARWGRHALRCESGGLGYAACSVLVGAGEGEGRTDPAPLPSVSEDDFDAITTAVNRLGHFPKIAVIQVYQLGAAKGDSHNARVLGISRQALTGFIHAAQRQIAQDISLKGRT